MALNPPPDLVLRDVHAAASTPWWPPAPGWWMVFAVLAFAIAAFAFFAHRRRVRRRAIARLFDDALAAAHTPTAQIAAMSELLRRAARVRDPAADRYSGDAWRAHLDAGAKQRLFDDDTGALLIDGAFRRDVDAHAVATLRDRARRRYLEWMQ
jgi:HAMP domain-containing protein